MWQFEIMFILEFLNFLTILDGQRTKENHEKKQDFTLKCNYFQN